MVSPATVPMGFAQRPRYVADLCHDLVTASCLRDVGRCLVSFVGTYTEGGRLRLDFLALPLGWLALVWSAAGTLITQGNILLNLATRQGNKLGHLSQLRFPVQTHPRTDSM